MDKLRKTVEQGVYQLNIKGVSYEPGKNDLQEVLIIYNKYRNIVVSKEYDSSLYYMSGGNWIGFRTSHLSDAVYHILDILNIDNFHHIIYEIQEEIKKNEIHV